MPIIYQHQPDEAITWRKIAFDEDGDWWAGIQKCGAVVALAATLAAGAVSTQAAIQVAAQPQDEAPHTVVAFHPDEDYWQIPVPPAASISVAQPIFDTPEYVFQPDEDYWINPARPVASVNLLQPFFDTPEYVFQPDEDYWQAALKSPAASNLPLYFFDTQDIVPQPVVSFTPEEDYWQAPAPFVLARFASQPFADSGDIFQQPAPPPVTKTYYMPDFNPISYDWSHCFIDLGFGRTIEFVNGQYTTSDPAVQAFLDTKAGLVSKVIWQGDYTSINRLAGHPDHGLPRS